MKCEGKCELLREAEYEVVVNVAGKTETHHLCGICMLDRCFATNGLRDDVTVIMRLIERNERRKALV